MDPNIVQKIAYSVIPVILAITLHEAAHGYVANKLGDPTARLLGRITANPLKHIDPIGTLLVPGLMLMTSGFLFGWAKPVPVAMNNLKRPIRDMGIVAAAGPASNIVMALIWALVLKLQIATNIGHEFFVQMALVGIMINLVLAALNLLPMPPLDGGRILVALLPRPLGRVVSQIEPYGLFIMLALLFTGALSTVLSPMIGLGQNIIFSLLGLN
ncbi:MAG: site-2 protease family protein [Burkholderiaceae bacterium]